MKDPETYPSSPAPARRALLATNDKALPRLLSTLLEPLGFTVQTIPMNAKGPAKPNDYVILMFDGDPEYTVADMMPAVVVIAPSDPVAMYDDGADLVVDKPLIANVFMAKIRAVLRRYGVRI